MKKSSTKPQSEPHGDISEHVQTGGKVWAMELLRSLERAGAGNRSYIFVGAAGWGKRNLAVDYARMLLCEEKAGSEISPCSSCAKILAGAHPDVSWYGMDTEKRSIAIAEVRELLEWLSLKPFHGCSKIAVVRGAEWLTREAANAMLKLLEEPPPSARLILLVEHLEKILATIRSRSIIIRLKPTSVQEITKELKKRGVGLTEAEFLARKAEGSLKQAVSLHESGEWEGRHALIDGFITKGPHATFNEWSKLKRVEITSLLRKLEDWFRDALIVAASGREEKLIYRDRLAELKHFAEEGVHTLHRKLAFLIETDRAIQSNVNQKLALARLTMLFDF